MSKKVSFNFKTLHVEVTHTGTVFAVCEDTSKKYKTNVSLTETVSVFSIFKVFKAINKKEFLFS